MLKYLTAKDMLPNTGDRFPIVLPLRGKPSQINLGLIAPIKQLDAFELNDLISKNSDLKKIVLFGSAANGHAGPESDIDIVTYWDEAHALDWNKCLVSGERLGTTRVDEINGNTLGSILGDKWFTPELLKTGVIIL